MTAGPGPTLGTTAWCSCRDGAGSWSSPLEWPSKSDWDPIHQGSGVAWGGWGTENWPTPPWFVKHIVVCIVVTTKTWLIRIQGPKPSSSFPRKFEFKDIECPTGCQLWCSYFTFIKPATQNLCFWVPSSSRKRKLIGKHKSKPFKQLMHHTAWPISPKLPKKGLETSFKCVKQEP